MKTPQQQSSEYYLTVIIPIINVLLSCWKVHIHIRNEKNLNVSIHHYDALLGWVYTRCNLDISYTSHCTKNEVFH